MQRVYLPALIAVTALAALSPAQAWWTNGHSIIAEAAVRSLPDDVPAAFRSGAGLVAHCAQDPDVTKSPATPINKDREEPDHYIDWELLQGKPLPANRYDFVKQCLDQHQDPRHVGLLPYSTAEWTERLAVAFAEQRKWPDNPYIPTKCQVYAGILAHYTGDLCQPLHVTLSFDGRALPDGSSPKSGIHAAVDSLIEKLELKPTDLAKGQKIEPVDALRPAILKEIGESRSHIDQTYALEASLPPRNGAWTPTPAVKEFGTERAREATRFTAAMILTAWRKSAHITIPNFIERNDTPGAKAAN
jgi:hypothetical protein